MRFSSVKSLKKNFFLNMFVDVLYLWNYFRENVWYCGFDLDFVEKEMIG